MTLTLTIDDPTEATRLVNDFCSASKYDPASGKTKAQWVKEQLAMYLKQTARRGEFKDTSAVITAQIEAIVIY